MASCYQKICCPPSAYRDIKIKLNMKYPVEENRKPLHNISLIKRQEGMATVEATLVIPVFMVAITLLLQMGIVCVVQAQVYGAFSESMQQVAAHTYIYDAMESETVANTGVYGDVLISLQTELKNISLIDTYVTGGAKGVLLTRALLDDEGYLRGNIRYSISLKVPFFMLSSICIREQISQKAYTGFTTSSEDDIYVYVTDFQSVYHLSRNCSHLKLSIYELEQGEKCTLPPCSYCGSSGDALYITKEGDCYHTTLACQGLKRTIRRVKKSTVAGLPACEKCGR